MRSHNGFIRPPMIPSGSKRARCIRRRDARARFGNPYSYRERALDGVMATWLEGMYKETAFAARRLRRAPVFAITAVVTLALAVAANVSIFAVVERVILNPLRYPESD